MGINGLNTFLKEKVPQCIQEVHFSKFAGQKVAIDTSIYFYKFLYKNDRYIEGFFQQIYRLMSNKIMPVYIFDGAPPPEKKEVLEQRKEKRKLLNESISELQKKIDDKNQETSLNDIMNLQKLKKKNIYVTRNHYDNLKKFLNILGIPYVQSSEEADLLCNTLVIKDKVQLIMSDDMDVLVGGAKHILRNFNISSNKILYYNLDKIQTNLELNNEQWINLCILSGCDYLSRVPGIGVKNAYKLIKKHQNLNDIYNVFSHKAPNDYIDQFSKAKDLFTKIIETEEINNLVLTKKNCNMEQISPFLREYTNLTEKQINNRLNIINNFTLP
jgi:flap endonuclease-1